MAANGATAEAPETGFELRPALSIDAYLAAAIAGSVIGVLTYVLVGATFSFFHPFEPKSAGEIIKSIASEFFTLRMLVWLVFLILATFLITFFTMFPFVIISIGFLKYLNLTGWISFTVISVITAYLIFFMYIAIWQDFELRFLIANLYRATLAIPAGIIAGLTYRSVLVQEQSKAGRGQSNANAAPPIGRGG